MGTQQNKLDSNAMRIFLMNNTLENSKNQDKSKEIKEFKLCDYLNQKKANVKPNS